MYRVEKKSYHFRASPQPKTCNKELRSKNTQMLQKVSSNTYRVLNCIESSLELRVHYTLAKLCTLEKYNKKC